MRFFSSQSFWICCLIYVEFSRFLQILLEISSKAVQSIHVSQQPNRGLFPVKLPQKLKRREKKIIEQRLPDDDWLKLFFLHFELPWCCLAPASLQWVSFRIPATNIIKQKIRQESSCRDLWRQKFLFAKIASSQFEFGSMQFEPSSIFPYSYIFYNLRIHNLSQVKRTSLISSNWWNIFWTFLSGCHHFNFFKLHCRSLC